MVQLAKHAGAQVTAVCSGPNTDPVTRLGVDRVPDHTSAEFSAGSDRYDVVVDYEVAQQSHHPNLRTVNESRKVEDHLRLSLGIGQRLDLPAARPIPIAAGTE